MLVDTHCSAYLHRALWNKHLEIFYQNIKILFEFHFILESPTKLELKGYTP
jgi:hypothetical protein